MPARTDDKLIMETFDRELSSGICRCCLDRGVFNQNYNTLNCLAIDVKNISYINMFSSCFSVNITCSQLNMAEYYICDLCIIRLKDAFSFKEQVEIAQKKFHTKLEIETKKSVDEDNVSENYSLDDDWDVEYLEEDYDVLSKETFNKTQSSIPQKRSLNKTMRSPEGMFSKRLEKCEPRTDWNLINKKYGTKCVNFCDWDRFLNSKICLKENRCLVCKEVFFSKHRLNMHLSTHYPIFSCPDCNKSFARRAGILNHKLVHFEGTFSCNKCNKIFNTKSKLHSHTAKHATYSRYPCQLCSERFDDYYKLQTHKVIKHNAPKNPFKCKLCKATFLGQTKLNTHFRRIHMKERNQICSVCGASFFSGAELRDHMIGHSGERTYSCDVCKKKYPRKKTLREHMKIHTNDKRFVCCLCDRMFTQKCTLKGHMNTHKELSHTFKEIQKVTSSGQIFTFMDVLKEEESS